MIKKLSKKFESSPFRSFLNYPLLIIYFLSFRLLFGFHIWTAYLLIFLLLIMKNSTEKISFIFFFLVIFAYIFFPEADFYMSIVYIFLVISVFKHLIMHVMSRFSKTQ